MNPKKQLFYIALCFLFPLFSGFTQNRDDRILKKLDSIAFTSLENNDPLVLDHANKLLEESSKGKPSFYQVNAYTIMGIVNKNRGFYVTSLDYYLKALNASKLLKDSPRQSACLNNIGSVYQLQGKYNQAIDYYNQSLELEKKLDQPLQKSIRLYNLGECYKDIDSLDLALTYFNNSLLIERRNNNAEGIIYANLGIADVYIKILQFIDAKIVLENIEKKIKPSQIEEKIILHKLKGKLFKESGKQVEALNEFLQGENISKKYNIRTHLLELMKLQIKIYEASSQWQQAANKYREFVFLNDEMNSLHIKNQLDDLNYRNEITKKQLEIELVQEERDLAKKNEKFEKNLRIYGLKITWFVVILLIFSISLILYGVKKLTVSKE